MNTQELLIRLQSLFPESIEVAVEYAYQRGDLSDSEYRTWTTRIIEAERQKTIKLLAQIAA